MKPYGMRDPKDRRRILAYDIECASCQSETFLDTSTKTKKGFESKLTAHGWKLQGEDWICPNCAAQGD